MGSSYSYFILQIKLMAECFALGCAPQNEIAERFYLHLSV
jgi:hypothetical protein